MWKQYNAHYTTDGNWWPFHSLLCSVSELWIYAVTYFWSNDLLV